MIVQGIKHIYYRGYLKSCDYRCPYCPFHKRKVSIKELEEDQKALAQFIARVEKIETPVSIMFVPYGEAMNHKHYQNAIAYLSGMPHVTKVGCQTNLEFNIHDLEESIRDQVGNWSKLRFWCSYHPDMVGEETFVGQCEALIKHRISFCVGAVAVPQNILALQNLRQHLPKDIYMWLNKMDGIKRAYTTSEIADFTTIDPLFQMQLKGWLQNKDRCMGGKESLFVEANGDYYPCNINKVAIGNLYTKENSEWVCKNKRCSCYLAYVHQMNQVESKIFGDEKYFRIPNKERVKTFFFDLDGTLLNSNGILDKKTKDTIRTLAKTKNIYLATSRPYESAMKKCGDITKFLAGGVFANGAQCYIAHTEKWYQTPLNPVCLESLRQFEKESVKVKIYKEQNSIYKITVIANRTALKRIKQYLEDTYTNVYRITLEGNTLGITAIECSKLTGIQKILTKEQYLQTEVAVVGNSINDFEMLQAFEESIAVPSSVKAIKSHAKWVMAIESLPWIY